ncbi:uncharacterized protein LOC128201532 [Galleria mellonella]|uniref:Uncharacterized protein LOC128201532 n=2 Tax=Galleria mellonella TaxID=7137 RepID=A0ABM3MTT5_GALME|nr:uncharacterized protein LOC128201532 [Galleria mellonella]
MQYIIDNENLTDTYAYLDDVTVCGKDKLTHDANLAKFMTAVEKYKITLNKDKCKFGSESINLLGYTIENNTVKPDKERLKPLLSMPAPTDLTSLKKILGMFAHFSRWINNYSEKISPLITNNSFPLSHEASESFESIKKDIANAALVAIDDTQMFTVETDASDHALAATLSQNGRPVAFFSRSLTDSERNHSSIEKEASAIVESLRKWRHHLIGKHFLLITDQQSVSFMFNQKHTSKIKNEKIERWRLELSCFKFDIVYRPGRQNIVSDALSRVCASTFSRKNLYQLHNTLCHPGITRMAHWVRSKNLPYSLVEIKDMTASCPIWAEIKPRFANSKGRLIKATSPFERLSLDFKGPLPSNTENKYILTIVDEFSRFPFAYPCKDVSSGTVITCLKDLFFTFGTPLYIHSDRGAGFMSQEFKDFLLRNNIACSRTTPYNPEGNGQVERLNGTLWRTIQLSLRSKNLDIRYWEQVLPLALHSIRSLLCTATNATPHDKLLCFPRRSGNGISLPSWLMIPGPILLKKNVRKSKYDPLVEEVELLESNPNYSLVRFADGREDTVSNRHLAPINRLVGDIANTDEIENSDRSRTDTDTESYNTTTETDNLNADGTGPSMVVDSSQRLIRERRPPAYLGDYEL